MDEISKRNYKIKLNKIKFNFLLSLSFYLKKNKDFEKNGIIQNKKTTS